MSGVSIARTALVASLVIWAGALVTTQFTQGRAVEIAAVIAMYSVAAIAASAAACVILAVSAKRKAQ